MTVTNAVRHPHPSLSARVLAGGPPYRYAREDAGWEP
jgi:hypothetical protein